MNKQWLKAAGIRAIKTIAQTALGITGGCIYLQDINWTLVVSASVLAGFFSLLTSIAGLPELEK